MCRVNAYPKPFLLKWRSPRAKIILWINFDISNDYNYQNKNNNAVLDIAKSMILLNRTIYLPGST